MRFPPEERTIGTPEGGWQKGTYLVDVSFQTGNPIHPAVLHVKFLKNGKPINEVLWSPNWEREYRVRDVHYLEVVRRSDELSEFL